MSTPSQTDQIAALERTLADVSATLTKIKDACASPLAQGHNPDKLTEEQVGIKDGWRLLTEDERVERARQTDDSDQLQTWSRPHHWLTGRWNGNSQTCTYRTLKPAGFFLPAPQPVIAKDPMDGVKVGDYVTHDETFCGGNPNLVNGATYRVKVIDSLCGHLEVGSRDDGWSRKRFRPATRAEIESFLLKEAADLGFVIGAKVTSNTNAGPITKLMVRFKNDPCVSSAVCDREAEKGAPFVSVQFDKMWSQPLSALTLVKDDPIEIVVEGQTYKADFSQPGLVIFGCAKIAVSQIHAAHVFMSNLFLVHSQTNRVIEGVFIGKGLFTRQLLDKLIKRLDAQ